MRKTKKGVSFSVLSVHYLVLLLILFVGLLLTAKRISAQYRQVINQIDNSYDFKRSSQIIRDSSNSLSEKAEFFVMTHQVEYAEAYFNEKYHNSKREGALQDLYKVTENSDLYRQRLKIAMTQADSLSGIEIYAIRLAYEAAGVKKLPMEVAFIEIRPNDLRNSPEEYQKVAQQVLYNDGYKLYKERVNQNCAGIIFDLENHIRKDLQVKAFKLQNIIVVSLSLQVALIILIAIYFVCAFYYIFMPLKEFSDSIKNEKHLPLHGAAEIRYLAETYNNVHDYDELTKLLNRRGFNAACDMASGYNRPVGFLLVDVDDFKKVNDTYGHSAGDFILEKIAALLAEVFVKNAVARIGGDEFAIIADNISLGNSALLVEKINSINMELSKLEKYKNVSISAGIAFSEAGYSNELFRNADKALYSVKYGSKHGTAVCETVLLK